MQWLVFWLVYPLLWCISKLPFWLFYKVSDAVYVLVYYIIGYRRKTVVYNLKTAFPEKTDDERKAIAKAFYKHMCDMFLEMIKSISPLRCFFRIINVASLLFMSPEFHFWRMSLINLSKRLFLMRL